MPGTLVHDANVIRLDTGVTLNAAGTTTTNPIQEIDKPGRIRVKAAFGTVTSTGNSATFQFAVQGADDLAFSVNVVTHGISAVESGTDAALSNTVRYLDIVSYKRYIRANVVLGGTAPVFTGTVIEVDEPNYDRIAKTDTA
jgi:hypothetical protein